MNRIVCVGEGHGEKKALPKLCARVLKRLGVHGWHVDDDAVWQSRSKLVDEKTASPMRGANLTGLSRAVQLAAARRARVSGTLAVVVACDADNDCPATWGPSAMSVISPIIPNGAAGVVMIVREFETWFLLSRTAAELAAAGVTGAAKKRNAKGAMGRLVRGYLPTLHQLEEVMRLDIDRVWSQSDSFDKLVRDLARICGVPCPHRPR